MEWEEIVVFPLVGRAQGEGWQSTHSEKQKAKRLKRQSPGEENMKDAKTEGSEGWNPKDNLWENYAHDSCMGNTEATNARARHQGAPVEKKGK